MGEKVVDKVIKILKENYKTGLTITELVKVSKLSRHSVLTALAKLEGAGKVSIRKAGMAKIYSLNGGKMKLFGLFVILVFIFPLVLSEDISSDTITSIPPKVDDMEVLDSMQKIYELSPSALERGYYETLNEKDAFRLNIREKNYYIVVWNISDENVLMTFPDERKFDLTPNFTLMIDVDRDNRLDVTLILETIFPEKRAKFYIKKFVEEEIIPTEEYFELFDVTVRLAKEEISSSRDLGALITFENFGEGPSAIDIVYSIINKDGTEVYKGVDFKVVQTEDLVVKNFDFLELPTGNYILRTEIFYGDNQTGESEQDFIVTGRSYFSLLLPFLIFVLVIFSLWILISVFKKKGKTKIL